MAGLRLDDVPNEEQWATFVENMRHAGQVCAEHGLTLLVEPLNLRDNPGYFFSGSAMGLLVAEVGLPNAKLQIPTSTTCSAAKGSAVTIERNLAQIGHIQIADNPGRHQPGRARSTIRSSLPTSTASATTVTSRSNTARSAQPRSRWVGLRSMG